MRRIGLVIVGIAILVVFLARGDAQKPQEPAAEPLAPRPRVPIPLPPEKSPSEKARGIYVLETDGSRIALDLREGREFRSVAMLKGREPRETSGTWSLAGRNLTLTYRFEGGKPIPDGPKYEKCRYLGSTIELKVPGQAAPVVLRKAAVIRQR